MSAEQTLGQRLSQLRRFFEGPLGKRLGAVERSRLRLWLAEWHEQNLLMLAPPWSALPLDGCPVQYQWQLEPRLGVPASLYARLEALPIEEGYLAAAVLPHVLEWTEDPYATLREVHHVLKPEGRLVVLGLNPVSLLGLWVRARRGSAFAWCSRQIGPARLREWLTLLGFQVTRSRLLFFRPPVEHSLLLERLAGLETLGERGWPLPGGVYMIEARKRVRPLTLIRPRWMRGRVPAMGGLASSRAGLGLQRRR